MRMQDIRETNRVATKALLGELGYDPNEVLDRRGDAVLDWDEGDGVFVLDILERDDAGKIIVEGHEARTRTERVTVTDEQLNAYRAALWSPGKKVPS